MSFGFFTVDDNYINFLKQYDDKIPNNSYSTHNKFVCGIVLQINGNDYYAPISHFNKKQRTNFPIYNQNKIISTIRLCFMFPVPNNQNVLNKLHFSAIKNVDPNYANLLQQEYSYCVNHMIDLKNQSYKVYKIGITKTHPLNYTCCDFRKLEPICNYYDPANLYNPKDKKEMVTL